MPSQCRGEFQLRSHDSFKISGETSLWHWKSRDIGGKSALDYAPIPPGTKGTVTYVDDMGQIGVNWDTGSSLALVPGEDSFSKVPESEKTKSNRGMSR